MSKHTNIIDLSVAMDARRKHQTDMPSGAEGSVIDLQGRNRAGASESRLFCAGSESDQLSAGEVWDALSDDRLVVHYQPQYDMRTNKLVAAEALIRLIDTDGQLIYPNRFIGPVEQRDLILPLGREVIERACIDLARIRARGLFLRRIAINLSAHQIAADKDLISFIDRTISRYKLKYSDLEFELTERQGFESKSEGPEVIRKLAERGSRIVIDDFGLGYSSVAYLADLPVAAFKLDRSLVDRIGNDGPARALINGLLGMARNLGLDVVAEGVETSEQGDYLRAVGCRLAQGFGYARPMWIEDLIDHYADDCTHTDYPRIGA